MTDKEIFLLALKNLIKTVAPNIAEDYKQLEALVLNFDAVWEFTNKKSLRDRIALIAMKELINLIGLDYRKPDLAIRAYKIADEMMRQREA